jgi:hypothetical protein
MWWNHFLTPFFNPFAAHLKHPPLPTFAAYLAPVTVFMLAIFACGYWLLSSSWYLEETLAKMEQAAVTSEEHERAERTREGLAYVSANPGLRMLLSAQTALSIVRSLAVWLCVVWLLLSFISDRWHTVPQFWLLSTGSLAILTAAALVNTLLKFLLLKPTAALGAPLLFDSPQHDSPLHTLLVQCDFLLWYSVALLSHRTSGLFGERPATIFLSAFGLWIMLVLILRAFFGINTSLTLN